MNLPFNAGLLVDTQHFYFVLEQSMELVNTA